MRLIQPLVRLPHSHIDPNWLSTVERASRTRPREFYEWAADLILSVTGSLPGSSIKGKVKKNTSPPARNFLTFQPLSMSEVGFGLPPHRLGSLHSLSGLFGFSLLAVFIAPLRRSPSVLRPTSKPVVRCQPWFYLRLVAYRFFGLSERA
jgi:hypothetical protein